MTSRRDFLQQFGVAGLGAALAPGSALGESADPGAPPLHAAGTQARDAPSVAVDTAVVPLVGTWQFRTDPKSLGERERWFAREAGTVGWLDVTVPHTWQVQPATVDYFGDAWYRRTFFAPETWAAAWVRLQFEAVYHSATVWLNGQRLGEHLRKGYTAFELDVSPALRLGQENLLVVRANNAFDEAMLPRGRSFDWAADGGMTRPVSLLVTPRCFVDRIHVDAVPAAGGKQATISARCLIRNAGAQRSSARLRYRIEQEETGRVVGEGEGESVRLDGGKSREAALPPVTLADPTLWHFDHPHLYRLVVELRAPGQPPHSAQATFGIRSFTAHDGGLYLNGERVRLIGVERMAGSHPGYGMAEPGDWIEHDHADMKELGCVYTRTHWPQDRRVLDFCDRHGILFQPEVPTWGGATFKGTGEEPELEILRNGLEQLREMVERDYNHPCIVAWGLCNEVDATREPVVRFVRAMHQEAKRLDPARLTTYASNSLHVLDPARDRGAAVVDIVEWNDYYETWLKGGLEAVGPNLERIGRAFPGKPIIVSEYGYCECAPDRLRGDPGRVEILKAHTAVYRQHAQVAGAIFFDYNDYRTHMGDRGLGALLQRVHGVVDLFGARKPSFAALARESSPLERLEIRRTDGGLAAQLTNRAVLPAYWLRGYRVAWTAYDAEDIPVERGERELAPLGPGESAQVDVSLATPSPVRLALEVLRPTLFPVGRAEWRARPA